MAIGKKKKKKLAMMAAVGSMSGGKVMIPPTQCLSDRKLPQN